MPARVAISRLGVEASPRPLCRGGRAAGWGKYSQTVETIPRRSAFWVCYVSGRPVPEATSAGAFETSSVPGPLLSRGQTGFEGSPCHVSPYLPIGRIGDDVPQQLLSYRQDGIPGPRRAHVAAIAGLESSLQMPEKRPHRPRDGRIWLRDGCCGAIQDRESEAKAVVYRM